jgi:hypothetical protein
MRDMMVVLVMMPSLLVLINPGKSPVHVLKVNLGLSERHKETGAP